MVVTDKIKPRLELGPDRYDTSTTAARRQGGSICMVYAHIGFGTMQVKLRMPLVLFHPSFFVSVHTSIQSVCAVYTFLFATKEPTAPHISQSVR